MNNMQISDLKNNNLSQAQTLRPGERVLVEVLRGNQSGLAMVLLKDRVMQAEVQTMVQAGERFFAIVGEKQAEGILLVRADRPAAEQSGTAEKLDGSLIKLLSKGDAPAGQAGKTAGTAERPESARLLVEVLKGNQNGPAAILLNGRPMLAKMDVPVRAGDRFFAVAAEPEADGVVAIKTDLTAKEIANLREKPVERPNNQVLQRGILSNDSEVARLVRHMPEQRSDWKSWLDTLKNADPLKNSDTLKSVLKNFNLPEWQSMEKEGSAKIIDFLKKMGVEYEAGLSHLSQERVVQTPARSPAQSPARLAVPEGTPPGGGRQAAPGLERGTAGTAATVTTAAKSHWTQPGWTQNAEALEQDKLSQTLKGALLKELTLVHPRQAAQHQVLNQVLDHITSQQLWLQSGADDNAFFLLYLPLKYPNGDVNEVRIAAEAKRKGAKIDYQHCRVAFLTHTEQLGDVGVDVWLGSEGVDMRLLSDQPEEVRSLMEALWPETRERISHQGWQVRSVEVSRLDLNTEFLRFVQGAKRSGVDLQG
ncbi:MAG: hypothetical protein LBT32_01235 [Peptococcaceae bacterium]|jgi:hypothetical protein|nr:hypothetical protein [Peptococcaceae bacterium]